MPAVALVLVLGVTGCGNDEEPAGGVPDEPAADAEGDEQAAGAFCDTALQLGNPGEPEVDWETATEEEMAAAQQVFAEDRLRPIVEDLRDQAPEELQGDVDTLDQVLQDAEESGDLEAFFTGEGGEARGNIADTAAQDCGWSGVDVVGIDYGYEGVPDTLEAGTAIFSFSNEGEEAHEMILFRKQDGVAEDWEELLAMPEDEAMQSVEFTAAAFSPAGESSSASAELSAGDYAMVCFIPVGSDESATESGDGPPHYEEGMFAAFTVE